MSETAVTTKPMTPADLVALPERGRGYELIDGVLIEQRFSTYSCLISANIGHRLSNFCEDDGAAWVLGAGLGYHCFPGRPNTIRRPRASVILRERLPYDGLGQEFCTVAPDLAVEIVGPTDRADDVQRALVDYLAAGVRLIWIVTPPSRSLLVVRLDRSGNSLEATDELTGEDVLPGFRCLVGDLFPA